MSKDNKRFEIKGFPGFFTGNNLFGCRTLTDEEAERLKKNIIPIKKVEEKDE